MLDERFYEIRTELSLDELAQTGEAEIAQKVFSAKSLNSFVNAKSGDLTFLENARGVDFSLCEASVCFAPEELASKFPKTVSVLISKSPRWSFSQAAALIAQPKRFSASSDNISRTANISDNAELGPNVTIGDDVFIGEGTIIGPGTVIWPGVTIGKNCNIGSNTVIRSALIGDGVTIYSGAIIGENGFGLSIGNQGAIDTPHFGRVVIQDNVSIGANTCIDRGVFADTLIQERVKIDNMCHISHNVEIGAHSVLAAQCGIAGSTKIGAGTQMGGACGVADHLEIGIGVKLAGHSGLMSNIPDGETWGGYPAKPIKQWFRENVWVSKQLSNRKTNN